MLISVLIPTRKRFSLLDGCVKSLLMQAENKDTFEIIFRIDKDDCDQVVEIAKYDCNSKIIIGSRYNGYTNINVFYHEMCDLSKGKLLFVYNDDCLIQTYGWDKVMCQYADKVCVLKPMTNHPKPRSRPSPNVFPIVSKKIYDALGHLSLHTSIDSWMAEIVRPTNIEIPIDVLIHHDRPDLTNSVKDETWHDVRNSYYNKRNRENVFGSDKYVRARLDDIEKIKRLLEEEKHG